MLRELHITNLAVIEDARLELGEGLNCFTGQTGAGKSLVLGAFGLLLGLRSPLKPTEMLRPGADEGRVAGVFELRHEDVAKAIGALADLSLSAGDELLISRRFLASGRMSVSINGQPATAAMARAIGETLVDVHGQHDHQCLLKPAHQLALLDGFGACAEPREAFRKAHTRLREAEIAAARLAESSELRRQRLELLAFQLDELEQAQLTPGEYPELRARQRMLASLQRLRREASAAHAALYESEGAVVERLQAVTHVLQELALLDGRLTDTAAQVRDATLSLQDAAFELGRYSESLNLNPSELAEIEDRLNTLHRLLAKYRLEASRHADAGPAPDSARDLADDPIHSLIAFRDHAAQEEERLRAQSADLDGIEAQLDEWRRERDALALTLRTQRHAAGRRLTPLIEAELRELGMADAQVAIEWSEVEPGPQGADEMDILIRPNPGQPARPLRKIASGGEMSRVTLAIKAILAESDRVSVLVFDEIDANIGGRLGTVIGRKLRRLAAGGHQVLCITHLPQIAVFADRHLRISKQVTGKGNQRQTRTIVTPLQGEPRIDELSEMLAGREVSDTTRRQVREMILAAES